MGAIRGEAAQRRCPQLPPSCIFSPCRIRVHRPRGHVYQWERRRGGKASEAAWRAVWRRVVVMGGGRRAAGGEKSPAGRQRGSKWDADVEEQLGWVMLDEEGMRWVPGALSLG